MSAQPNVLDVYTPLHEVRAALKARREDPILQKKVNDFFGKHFPAFLEKPNMQYAFFSRPVITPNKEFHYFLDMVQMFDLPVRLLEYPDTFVSKNSEKRYAAKISAYALPGKSGGENKISKTLIDFSLAEGRPLKDLKTSSGASLIELHHRLLAHHHPSLTSSLFDITSWFKMVRDAYSHYYLAYLALAICHGVHFENYLEGDLDEHAFFKEKVAPSFAEAERLFGVRPLIYPLLPLEHEKNARWLHYTVDDIERIGDMENTPYPKKGYIG